MSRRRRRGAAGSEAQHMDERWAVSYLDMMTVLFLTFVVLFAMSSVDAGKYEQLRNALATGFGQHESDLDDTVGDLPAAAGAQNEHELAADGEPLAPPPPMTADQKLEQIQGQVQHHLEASGREAAVDLERSGNALVIRIVSGETLFTPDNAKLSTQAGELLAGITPSLLAHDAAVSVEGHADYRVPLNYETNWELSSDRAVKVVRYMIEEQGMPPDSVAASGFGATRPLGGDRDDLERNRRVDIVVHTQDDPDAA